MIGVFLAGILALATPTPCPGSDISVTDLQIKVIKGSAKAATADRLLITGTFTNVGLASQEPNLAQHAEFFQSPTLVGAGETVRRRARGLLERVQQEPDLPHRPHDAEGSGSQTEHRLRDY